MKECFFTKSPDHKDVIYKPTPGQGKQLLGLQESLLHAAHEVVGIGRSHPSSHGCSPDLFVGLAFKSEVIMGEDEVGKCDKERGFWKIFGWALGEVVLKGRETMGMWDVCVKECSIYGDKKGFRWERSGNGFEVF
ncbi:uncharacterized protein LOC126461098 [Schistocerca serialis cubense]|uniref:uncharacterized protein LOC126461098 n=1 Tax=Schistocerca serialis cubense TaxID=2023355 RepID=UPI00214EDFC2|nr:uncharacterized protein LOC126461098 [Schistocerca serialis cubense]